MASFSKKSTALEILQYLFSISLLLYFGKTVFIPLSVALLISLVLYPICKWLETKRFSKSMAIATSLTLVFLAVLLLLFLFIAQIFEFSNEWHILELKIEETINQLSIYLTNHFGINEEKQLSYIKSTINQSGAQVFTIFKSAVYSLTETFYYLLIVPLFSALILYYRQLLVAAL
jgi:predicted PurR-regulated permease PerM